MNRKGDDRFANRGISALGASAAAHQDWEAIELLSATLGSHRLSRCADRPGSPPTVGHAGSKQDG